MTQTFGKYQLDQLIAVGGMAEVFLARQSGPAGFQKQLVVKRILPQFAQDAKFIQMFLDEARLAAQLAHPNLVQIFELGEEQGAYYIAMEYIDGETVADIIDRANALGVRLPYHFAARVIAHVCAGLDYAHHFTTSSGEPLNLVHRDISPDNILVSWTGAVKTIDFGIAKAQTNRTKTQSGAVKGKFCYMSPEQVMGKPLDGRSDLFSVGIVLYELVTGVRPFGDDAGLMAVSAIVNEDPLPIRERARDIPEALEAIILKALAKDPDHRYARARDLQGDLETFIQSHARFVNDSEVGELMQALRRGEARDVTFVKRLQREIHTTVEDGAGGAQESSGSWRLPGLARRGSEPDSRSPPVGASAPSAASTQPAALGGFRKRSPTGLDPKKRNAILAGAVGGALALVLILVFTSSKDSLEPPADSRPPVDAALPEPVVATPAPPRPQAATEDEDEAPEGRDYDEQVVPTAALGSLEPASARFGDLRLPPIQDGTGPAAAANEAHAGSATADVTAGEIEADASASESTPDTRASAPDDAGPAAAEDTSGPVAEPDGGASGLEEDDDQPRSNFGTIRGEGKLILDSNLHGAEVWANGRKIGTTPLRMNLFDGTYDLEVRAGAARWVKDGVRIEYGGTRTFNARLSAGRVAIEGVPLGVLCTLDGVLVARSQFDGVFVASGDHEVVCDDPARGKRSVKVSVRAGASERAVIAWD